MDFVHDTLADRRPFRILAVGDHWSRSSPVLEAGFRMSGELVGQVLDRVLGEGPRPRSITVDHGTESNPGRWRIGPINAASNSTSFDQENL